VSFKVQTDSFSFQIDSFSLWTGIIFLFNPNYFLFNPNYSLFESELFSLWNWFIFSLDQNCFLFNPNYFLFGLELFSLGNWFIFFQPFIRLGPLMRQQLILLPILRESVLYQRKQLVRLFIVHSAYQNKGSPSVRKIFREKAKMQEKI
jgi:hypothetical protein